IGEAYQGTKPAEIEKDGKTYVLSTTKPVRSNEGDAPETGKVKEGKQTIVYQYVLKEDPTPEVKKGEVVVTYVDTEGEQIKTSVKDVENGDVDSDYDTVVDNRPEIIKTEDGKTYKLVPAGEYKVGTVDEQGHLTTSDATTGKVEEGTKTVTYVYRELGKYIPYIPE
ncbi:MucBP domain-containing protein, partial [Streptococcus sp. 121]|uniref:MucBP domain-containing protein n=1 Tax=Streptococcus sp. 121 TaxID=2797637 RepID=UPI0018F0B966